MCKYVLDAYCPNFFIPENNMFRNKMVGASREALLSQLIKYNAMGITCLLRCPSLNWYLAPAICYPVAIPYTTGYAISLFNIDKSICSELLRNHYFNDSKEKCYLIIRNITKLLEFTLSPFQYLALQQTMSDILFQTGFILANHSKSNRNKRGFKFRKTGILNLFLMYEDSFVLGDSERSGRRVLVSYKFTDLFLDVFQTPM